jgi:hypothetical protein
LTIASGEKGVVMNCHAHACSISDITGAIGLTPKDLFETNGHTAPPANGKAKRAFPTWEAAAAACGRAIGVSEWAGAWTYYDSEDQPWAVVVRFNRPDGSKEFRPIHRAADGWSIGDPPKAWYLYGLSELKGSDEAWVVEGEKAADALFNASLINAAVTSAHGSKSAHKTDWAPLAGRDVTILPDCDEPGEAYAQSVIDQLAKLSPRPRVRVLRLPGLSRGEDVADWIPRFIGGADPYSEKSRERVTAELRRLAAAEQWIEWDLTAGWPALKLTELPDVTAFPVEVLPPALRELARTIANEVGVPVDFPAADMLPIAAGLIGNSVALRLKPGYWARGSVYLAKVGPPSDGKSPSLQLLMRPIWEIDQELAEEYRRDHAAWSERRAAAQGEKITDPAPVFSRLSVDDATAESLIEIHGENPRGVLVIKDELRELFESLNQYKGGRGTDRSCFLKAWSGLPIVRDRLSNQNRRPTRVPRPCINICGGITPDKLGVLDDDAGAADGLIERFLFVWPRSVPVTDWADGGVTDYALEPWRKIVRRLWDRQPLRVGEGTIDALESGFTDAGREAWVDGYNAWAGRMRAHDIPPEMVPAARKLAAYAGRLSLILSALWQAADDQADHAKPPRVDGDHVCGAWALAEYFYQHALKVRSFRQAGAASCKYPGSFRNALAWASGRERFTRKELADARRWPAGMIDDVLAAMVAAGAVRPVAGQAKAGPGRRPSPAYEVHPDLRSSVRVTE